MGRARPGLNHAPRKRPLKTRRLAGRAGRRPAGHPLRPVLLPGLEESGRGRRTAGEGPGVKGCSGERPPGHRRLALLGDLLTRRPRLNHHLDSVLRRASLLPGWPSLRVSACPCPSNVTAAQVPQPWQDRPRWNFQSSSGTQELLVNINSERGERRQTRSARGRGCQARVRRPGDSGGRRRPRRQGLRAAGGTAGDATPSRFLGAWRPGPGAQVWV